MATKKGRLMYCPSSVIDELESIRYDKELDKKCEAFRKMVKYSQVGREMEKISKLQFGKKKRKEMR